MTISTATSNAVIRYTLDGSATTENSGTVYTNPIPINTTTPCAAAFKAGFKPTNVDTHTYIFLADDATTGKSCGLAHQLGRRPADYEMDPDVIGPANLFTNVYRGGGYQLSMLSIPTMSIVTKPIISWSSGSVRQPTIFRRCRRTPLLYRVFPTRRQREIQLNCGLRIHGGSSHALAT